MAGTYATDLIHLWTTANATGQTGASSNIVEMTGYAVGGGNNRINGDGDLYLSGGSSLTTNGGTGTGGVSLTLDYVTDGRAQITATAGHVIAFWSFIPTPTGADTFNGASSGFAGEQIVIGSASGTYRAYSVGGGDVDLFGGWNFRVLDPRNTLTGDSRGTYTANNPRIIGFLYEQIVTLRRPPVLGLDNIRYGRHTFTCTGGDFTAVNNVAPLTSSAANFSQAAEYNDYDGGGTPANGAAESGGYHKFGQFQGENVPGQKGFRLRGILSLGTNASPVNFSDTNSIINIPDEYLTYDDFTRIEFRNASSDIRLQNTTFLFNSRDERILAADAPATTRGNVECFNNPTVLLDGCSFADMGTFIFGSNTTVIDTAFRRSGTVTGNGASFTTCPVSNNDSFIVTDLSQLTQCTFIRNDGQSIHAVELTSLGTGTMNWSCIASAGYATGSLGTFTTANDAGANAAIFVNVASGTLTISVVSGGTIPSIRTAGATVVVEAQPTIFSVSGLKDGTEVRIINSSTNVEIAGVESVSGGVGTGINNGSGNVTISGTTDNNKFSYAYQYSADVPVFVAIVATGYEIIYQDSSLVSTDRDIPISQAIDRTYSNP